MEKITITKDEFREAVAEELERVMNIGKDKGIANVLVGMTCATFGAALTTRLFSKEDDEDGADS